MSGVQGKKPFPREMVEDVARMEGKELIILTLSLRGRWEDASAFCSLKRIFHSLSLLPNGAIVEPNGGIVGNFF